MTAKYLLSLIGLSMAFTPATGFVSRQEPRAADQEISAEDLDVGRAGDLMDQGKFDDAIIILTRVLQRSPRHGEALADRALSFGWTNRLAEAERDLKSAEKLIPDHAILHRVRAIIADRRSDEATVIAETTKSLEKEPGNVMALRFRANAYQSTKREAEAMVDADSYVKAHADDPDAYVFRANMAIRQRQRAAAADDAARLAKLFPDSAYAIASAARIEDSLGNRDKALNLVGDAIIMDPEYFYYHSLRAGMRRWDDWAGRRADLETADALDPNNLTVVAQLGVVAFKQERWSDSEAYFTRVLIHEPKDYGVLAYRSMVRRKAGNEHGARRDFDSAIASSSGADDYSMICRSLASEDQSLDWAEIACDKAVSADERKSAYRRNRGLLRIRQSQLAGALADYDAAVAADARVASNFYGRAVVRLRLGDSRGARADRDKALEIDPSVAEGFEEAGLALPTDM